MCVDDQYTIVIDELQVAVSPMFCNVTTFVLHTYRIEMLMR